MSWASVCKPTNEGGLGIRSMRLLEETFLFKRCWLLLNSASLWSTYMKGKYYPYSTFEAASKLNGSRMWKKLLISRNIFTNFCKCTIGNGSALTFLQNWSGLGPMIDYIPEHLRDSYDHKCISIADAITMGETFIHSLCNIISQDILVAFTKNITPIHQTAAFAYIWLLDQHGNFSIKSAYSESYISCNVTAQSKMLLKEQTLFILAGFGTNLFPYNILS